jgi:hypothetical protein
MPSKRDIETFVTHVCKDYNIAVDKSMTMGNCTNCQQMINQCTLDSSSFAPPPSPSQSSHVSSSASPSAYLNEIHYSIYDSYQRYIRFFKKECFDPCRRFGRFDERITISHDNRVIETTMCQMNFFKWFIISGGMQLFLDSIYNKTLHVNTQYVFDCV